VGPRTLDVIVLDGDHDRFYSYIMDGTEKLNQEEMWGHKEIISDVLNGDGKKYIPCPSKCQLY
jgi:hypothetical protein